MNQQQTDFSPAGQIESSTTILSGDWREPIPFEEPQETQGEPFPTDALPESLSGAVLAMARIIKAPSALCAQSVLSVTNLATQRLFDVEIDGRRNPSSLYFLTIGLSGERKSACDTASMAAVTEEESRLRAVSVPLTQKYLDAKETYKAERTAILNTRSLTQDKKKASLMLLEQPTDEPAPPLLKVTDGTIEGLQRAFAEGCSALGLFNDEGGTVLGGWSFKDENEIRAAAALSSLWDGKPVTRVRGGDGAHVLAGRRLCAHLQIQPVIARTVLSNGLLQGQGLLARFLVAHPPSSQGTRSYSEERLMETAGMIQFNKRIGELLKQPSPVAAGRRGELEPTPLQVEGQAKALWMVFYNSVEAELKRNGTLASIRPLANKMAEHALRLAATFAAVEDGCISLDTMSKAIDLAYWYLNEALRLSAPENHLGEDQETQLLWKYIAKQESGMFSTQKIYQSGPEFARSATKAKRLLEMLESHFWIRASEDGWWEVNPHA